MSRKMDYSYLLCYFSDHPGKEMILPLSMLRPRCEVPHLTIITVIGKPHLRADKQNLSVVYDDPAVIDYVLVYDWPVIHRTKALARKSNWKEEYKHSDIAYDVHGFA